MQIAKEEAEMADEEHPDCNLARDFISNLVFGSQTKKTMLSSLSKGYKTAFGHCKRHRSRVRMYC